MKKNQEVSEVSEIEAPRKMKKMSKKTRDTLVGYSFIGIWIIGFLVFMLVPVVNSVIYSFSIVKVESTGIKITPYGFGNFANIFKVRDGLDFTEALLNFSKDLIIQVPIIIVFSIICLILSRETFLSSAIS